MWLSPEFQAKLRKANVKPASAEVQEILDKEDDIPPTYDELETISKREWSRLEREAGRIGVRPPLLEEGTETMESESTSSVQPKRKPGRPVKIGQNYLSTTPR